MRYVEVKKMFFGFFALACSLVLWGETISSTPVDRLSENWWKRRFESKMQQLDAERSKIKVVLLGDSITHGWETAGKDVYAELFAEYPVLNLAFSGDHTGHTLWILEQDNIWKDLDAQLVVIMIGTNNIGWKKQPANETADAIKLVVRRVKERLPEAKILLYAVFPRGADANAVHRPMIDQINQEIVKLADNQTVFF